MKRISAGIIAATALGMLVAYAGELDDTKWKVKVVPDKEAGDAGEKEFDDELIFADNSVTATTCTQYGFSNSVYTAETRGETVRWKTMQRSETAGFAYWSGEVTGRNITGKLKWIKKDGSKLAYTYAGEREPK